MFSEILSLWKKDDLLKQSFVTAGEMLMLTKEMYLEVMQRTLKDGAPGFDIHERDQQLNDMEREIRRKVLEHLSINPQQDIVASLVLVSVVNDIERIGDYTKNLEELEELYTEDFSKLHGFKILKKCSDQVETFFDLTRKSFVSGDKTKARQVMKDYKGVGQNCDQVIEETFQDPTMNKNAALASVLFARYLKRICSHLKNIASSVVNPFDEIGYIGAPRKPKN